MRTEFPPETHIKLKSREISCASNWLLSCQLVLKVSHCRTLCKILKLFYNWNSSSEQTRFREFKFRFRRIYIAAISKISIGGGAHAICHHFCWWVSRCNGWFTLMIIPHTKGRCHLSWLPQRSDIGTCWSVLCIRFDVLNYFTEPMTVIAMMS